MGLDTYAVALTENGKIKRASKELFKDGIALVDSDDDGHFRGKVYAGVVLEATNQSLYFEILYPETVAKMSKDFDEWLDNHGQAPYIDEDWEISYEELKSLQKFFWICKEHELALRGSW